MAAISACPAAKNYLKATRLNAVRTEIRRGDLGVKIADIANLWGFWHLGQFARDYRNMFEELPSKTLARAKSLVEI